MPEKYTYLLLLIGSLAGPLALSFDHRVAFWRNWSALLPSIGIPAALFIWADIWFTHVGVWSFSSVYTLNINIFRIPIEEWAFFVVIPYCSLFIYAVIKSYFPKVANGDWSLAAGVFLVIFTTLMAISHTNKLYTFWNFSISTVVLVIAIALKWFRPWLGFFLLAWIVGLLPKLIVNGILTSLPVVSYNDAENAGLRIGTIPIEDYFYFFLLLLMNVLIFEWNNKGKHTKTANQD